MQANQLWKWGWLVNLLNALAYKKKYCNEYMGFDHRSAFRVILKKQCLNQYAILMANGKTRVPACCAGDLEFKFRATKSDKILQMNRDCFNNQHLFKFKSRRYVAKMKLEPKMID